MAQWQALWLAAPYGWMRSLADHTGMSVAAGQVGARAFVVVFSDCLTGAAAVGWTVKGTGCMCLFHGVCIIGMDRCEELGSPEATVGGALARRCVCALCYALLVAYDVDFSYTVPCVGAEMFVECI